MPRRSQISSQEIHKFLADHPGATSKGLTGLGDVPAPARADLSGKGRTSKYNAVRTTYRGWTFDSKAEAARAVELDGMVAAGTIRFWLRQVEFRLSDAEVSYRPDFVIIEADGTVVAEDVKGVETERFTVVKRLWVAYGPCPLHVRHKGRVEVIEGRSSLLQKGA